MINLSNLRLKVVDYYSSLFNKLDLEAETRIIQDMSKEEVINNLSEKFIDKIKQIEKINLTNLEKLYEMAENMHEERLNELVYENEFCFLVERKGITLIGYFLFVSPNYVNANKRSIIQNGYSQLDTSTKVETKDDILNGLSSVRKLDLSKAQLTSIDRDTLTGLTNLQILDLSENELSSIDLETSTGLTSLQILDLKVNQLTLIDRSATHFAV